MWVLTTFFALASLVLFWLSAAYFIVLRFVGIVKRRAASAPAELKLPRISVVVPLYNEAGIIREKLVNLLESDYPAYRLEIVFVDGGSTDGSLSILRDALPSDRRIRVYESPEKGKINQLNHVLTRLTGEFVVITDADGLMTPSTLRELAMEFMADESVWVVGAYSRPTDTIWRDRCFWDSQNRGRLIESDAHSSSIVIATCYAFRRGLLRQFPEDVVADDVHVAFLAHSSGRRVVYSRKAMVVESRGPCGISEFLSHKFRKNNAFLRESLRFIHRLPDMTGICKLMMITRTAQQLILPWCAFVWSILALTLLTMGRFDLLIISAASIFFGMMIARQAFQSVDIPAGTRERFGFHRYAVVFFETICVLFAAALSYPFYRQNSSYSRVGGEAANDRPGPARPAPGRIGGSMPAEALPQLGVLDRMGMPVGYPPSGRTFEVEPSTA